MVARPHVLDGFPPGQELSPPPTHTADWEDNLCCFQDILNLKENRARIEEQREKCVRDCVPTSKVPATTGGNREEPLCLLCSAGTLFTIHSLTCLRSQMPRAYKMLYFLFSQKCSYFCVWRSNCSVHHWWDLEGKDVSMESGVLDQAFRG